MLPPIQAGNGHGFQNKPGQRAARPGSKPGQPVGAARKTSASGKPQKTWREQLDEQLKEISDYVSKKNGEANKLNDKMSNTYEQRWRTQAKRFQLNERLIRPEFDGIKPAERTKIQQQINDMHTQEARLHHQYGKMYMGYTGLLGDIYGASL